MIGDRWLERFRRLAKSEPLPQGPVTGPANEALGVTRHVVLLVDDTGRVMQCTGGTLDNMQLHRIRNPRADMVRLFDDFGVEDWDKPA